MKALTPDQQQTIAFIVFIASAIALFVVCLIHANRELTAPEKPPIAEAPVPVIIPVTIAMTPLDQEEVYAEIYASDISGANEMMMWALRSNARFKWVELRAKPGAPERLLVVRHTQPKARP